MEIKGFKTFDKNMRDYLGKQYELGKVYSEDTTDGKKGIHFCKRIEDSLRGYDALNDDVIVAEVRSIDSSVEDRDDYYGYYDMYYASSLSIDRILSREEIVSAFLKMEPNKRVERFISSYRLTEPEVELFREKMVSNREIPIVVYQEDGSKEIDYQLPPDIKRLDNYITFYQEGNTEIFEQEAEKQKLKLQAR